MLKDTPELKIFTMRMPKDIWIFLKNTAVLQEQSMTDIVVGCVQKYKKKLEKKNSTQ